MELFRIILFLGLVFHKLLWEVLKRRARSAGSWKVSSSRPATYLLKGVRAVVLIFLMVQTLFLDLWPIADQSMLLRILGMVIYCVGFATAVTGRWHLGQNWVDLEQYQVLPEQSLVTKGIYRYIRHPIYVGDTLLLIGLELALNSWLVLAMLIPLLVIIRQAMAEEALLAQTFPDYQVYRRRTKRFIPFVL